MIDAVKIENLSKSYGEIKALQDISLEIRRGELFGLIGPDGAGKTSLFRIIVTLLLPDKGKVTVLGMDTVKDYRQIRPVLGYMPGRFSLYQDLTVEENLEFYATIFGASIKDNYYLIKDIYSHLEPFRKRLAGKLSGGMKQKLALSCAMIHKPEILVLDEPTTGVDAVSRKEFWELLANLKNQGITIIVSTPYMDEAAKCDRVALIQQGKILSVEKPETIISAFPGEILALRSENNYLLLKNLREYPRTKSAHTFGQCIHYTDIGGNITSIEDLKQFLAQKGIENLEITRVKAEIEDCFMELMQK